MNKDISITVPMDYFALTRASDMLHGLAQDLQKNEPTLNTVLDTEPEPAPNPGASSTAVDDQNVVAPDQSAAAVAPAAKTEPKRIDKPDPTSLDADGIPWDARIHTKSQLRLVKDNTWKLIRNVDKDLVEQVKAELLNAAPPATTPAAQAFSKPVAVTEPDPEPTGISFGDLMSKTTPRVVQNKQFGETIKAVLLEEGITGGLPSLMATPELLPKIDQRLDELWQG